MVRIEQAHDAEPTDRYADSKLRVSRLIRVRPSTGCLAAPSQVFQPNRSSDTILAAGLCRRRLSALSPVRLVCDAPPVSPRALLLIGLGLLFLGLLVVPDLGDLDLDESGVDDQSLAVRGYLSNACSLLGIGLVLAASVISALTKRQKPSRPPAPGIDHYS